MVSINNPLNATSLNPFLPSFSRREERDRVDEARPVWFEVRIG
jgi:hypothetical protein